GRDLLLVVRDLSLGFGTLGVEAGTRVAILSESRPEWLFTDFAVLAAGAVSTPVYPTLAAEQLAFILRDCGARLVVVSTSEQLDKLLSIVATTPDVRTIVTIDPCDGRAPEGVRLLGFEAVK